MFNECEVLLTQGSSREPDKTRWLYVTLLAPKMPAMAGQNVISYFDEVRTQGLVYWGKWRLGPNSVTKSRNDAFSIGSFRNRSRLWVWTGRNNVLDFLEYEDKVVNELTWGDIKAGPPVAVTLHNVQFSNRGASPANASGTDIGVSRVASQLFAKMTALSWKRERSSF